MSVADKRNLYVGGLDERVDAATLRSTQTYLYHQISLTSNTEKHRGFGFVSFSNVEDAAAAIDNMHNSELFGRVLNVNIAKPESRNVDGNKPVWETDEYHKKYGDPTQKPVEKEDK